MKNFRTFETENIFEELVIKRRLETNKLGEGIGFDNLSYYYTSKSAPKFFARFKSLLVIYNDIKNG